MMGDEVIYTVAEAAAILKNKGIITNRVTKNKYGDTKYNNGQEQVRKWIRAYWKEYEHWANYYKYQTKEEREKGAHDRAIEKGIRAHKNSLKEGYKITKTDLEEFMLGRTSLKSTYFNTYDMNMDVDKLSEKLLSERAFIDSPRDYKYGIRDGINYVINTLNKNKIELIDDYYTRQLISLPSHNEWKKLSFTIEGIRFAKTGNVYFINYRYPDITELAFTLHLQAASEIPPFVSFYYEDDKYTIPTQTENKLENMCHDGGYVNLVIEEMITQELKGAGFKGEGMEYKLAILMLLDDITKKK